MEIAMSEVELKERLKALEVMQDNIVDKRKEDKESFKSITDKLDNIIGKLDSRLDTIEKTQTKHGLVLKILIGTLVSAGALSSGLGPVLLKLF